jgi:transposase
VIDSGTGGVLGEVTVAATAAGYAESNVSGLVEFANTYPMLRAWAVEGTGGHGAGLSRYLLELSELVVELDRPKRSSRRHGAKSDPIDSPRCDKGRA